MSDYINRDLKESDFKNSDYINRDFTIYAFRRNSGYLDGNLFATDEAIVYLKQLPSADVVECKRGHWIGNKNNLYCSECGKDVMDYFVYSEDGCLREYPDFCPSCGVDMRGENRDEIN